VRTANLATLASGGVMIAVVAYLPSYAQGVLGTSALVAGFTLTTMSIGWPLASVTSGRLLPMLGARVMARAGGVALLTGALGLQLLGPERGPVWAAASSGVVGIGMGLLSTTFLVAIQTRVPWARRGAATSTNLLMRLLGNALGAALLGGIVNAGLRRWLQREGLADAYDLEAVTRLMEGAAPASAELPPGLREGLAGSIEAAFVATVVAAVAALALTFAMPDLTDEETAGPRS
jgi:MFS family permease